MDEKWVKIFRLVPLLASVEQKPVISRRHYLLRAQLGWYSKLANQSALLFPSTIFQWVLPLGIAKRTSRYFVVCSLTAPLKKYSWWLLSPSKRHGPRPALFQFSTSRIANWDLQLDFQDRPRFFGLDFSWR